VPDPHELRILVIPSIMENGVDEAVFSALNNGPAPWALGTAHARRPIDVAPKAMEDIMKGR